MTMRVNEPVSSIRAHGLGIIEVMIALALGAIILLGVTEIASRNSITRNEVESTGRQIESAIYALRTIESDLTSAGFWGETGEQSAGGTLPPACVGTDPDGLTEMTEALGYPVQGEDDLGGTPPCITSLKANTDFIAIRRVSSCALGPAECGSADDNYHLQANACFVLDDDTKPLPGEVSIAVDPNDLDYTQYNCTDSAPVYRFLSRIYYVSEYDEDGDGVVDHVLRRAELQGSEGSAAYEITGLVEGVELLKFVYGIDSDGDGMVDVEKPNPSDPSGPSGIEWSDVVMVRIHMVVRNLEPSPGYLDDRDYKVGGADYDATDFDAFKNHKRQLYTRTVSLRNVAGRREQQ
ncbi:MAG: PilW family protein [Halioglobus sp.]